MTNKITIAVLAITAILMSSCQLDTGNHFSEKENIYTVEEIEGRSTRDVIINGDIVMLVNTGNPSINVDRVEVHDLDDTYIATFSGCGSHECQIDISSLSADTYEATVYFSIGGSFSKQFTVTN